VIGTVTRRSVLMVVALGARQEAVERVDQVGLRTGAELHQPHARRGVRREDREQPVAHTGAERKHRLGDVRHAPSGAVDVDLGCLHEEYLPRRRADACVTQTVDDPLGAVRARHRLFPPGQQPLDLCS